jgi:LPXTG-motif cell wall-anchored protein
MALLETQEVESISTQEEASKPATSNNSFALAGLAVIAVLVGLVALRRRSSK